MSKEHPGLEAILASAPDELRKHTAALQAVVKTSQKIRWSDGLAAALVGAGRTTEQVHSGTISTFEERLETFFDEFRRWCTQVEERPEHRDGDPHSLR